MIFLINILTVLKSCGWNRRFISWRI